MSGVSGAVRSDDFTKETGFFEAKVVCINPDREKLEKLLGTQLKKDPEYLGETEGGVTKFNIVFWVKDVKTEKLRAVRFFLEDSKRQSNDKLKYQYINGVGATSWADSEDNLFDWFKERGFRVAYKGEEELYNFVLNWLGKLDTKDKKASVSFDWKKLMRGNISELSSEIGGQFESTITCLCTVNVTEKDGEIKEYEQIYSREFLPGYIMKTIRVLDQGKGIDAAFIENAKMIEKKKQTKLQKFVLSVLDSQYGIKDYFTLGELKKYDPSKNIAASDKIISDGDTSY